MSMLIRLSDVIDSKVQKEKELEFYQRELQKLNQKMAILREEITVTNIIIDLVRSEKVRDFKKEFEKKQKNPSTWGYMLGSFIGISIEQTEVDRRLTAAVRQSKHGFL